MPKIVLSCIYTHGERRKPKIGAGVWERGLYKRPRNREVVVRFAVRKLLLWAYLTSVAGLRNPTMFYLFRDAENDHHIYGEAQTEDEAIETGKNWIKNGCKMVWIQCFPMPPIERRDLIKKAEEKIVQHTI